MKSELFKTLPVKTQSPIPFAVLGFPVHLHRHYLDWILQRLSHRQGTHIVTLNAEMTMQAETDLRLASVIRNADLVIPDGAGIVLYLRLNGQKVERCPGIELSIHLLQASATQSPEPLSIFFYGGSPGTAEQAAQELQQQIPGLRIIGTQHGYLNDGEQVVFMEQLKVLQPNIVFVGLGVPRQEYWIAEHRDVLPEATWIGVGGSFDIWANQKKRAPAWLRNNHLEWVYRLYQEPWRWRRMLALPKFAWRSVLEKFS
jgi:N-acetylglucosaminyldiphosphoundecaprenol N-acetyl-beta-D-mannosaminyltransferase